MKLEPIEFADLEVCKKHEENTNLQGFGLEQIEQCIFIYSFQEESGDHEELIFTPTKFEISIGHPSVSNRTALSAWDCNIRELSMLELGIWESSKFICFSS